MPHAYQSDITDTAERCLWTRRLDLGAPLFSRRPVRYSRMHGIEMILIWWVILLGFYFVGFYVMGYTTQSRRQPRNLMPRCYDPHPEGTSPVVFPVGQAPRQGDRQEFTAVRRIAIWILLDSTTCSILSDLKQCAWRDDIRLNSVHLRCNLELMTT